MYHTFERSLDAWKAQQQTARPPSIDLPDEIAAKGDEFVRSLWAAAAGLADQRAQQAREKAQRQVEEARAALADAEAAIARLEAEGEEQAQRLTSQEQTIAQLRDELAQARTAAQVAEARAASRRSALMTCGASSIWSISRWRAWPKRANRPTLPRSIMPACPASSTRSSGSFRIRLRSSSG